MSSTVRDVNNNYGGPEIVETRNEGANQLHHKFPLPPPSTVWGIAYTFTAGHTRKGRWEGGGHHWKKDAPERVVLSRISFI